MKHPTYSTLEEKLQASESPVEMLRHSTTGGYEFPFPAEYTNRLNED